MLGSCVPGPHHFHCRAVALRDPHAQQVATVELHICVGFMPFHVGSHQDDVTDAEPPQATSLCLKLHALARCMSPICFIGYTVRLHTEILFCYTNCATFCRSKIYVYK